METLFIPLDNEPSKLLTIFISIGSENRGNKLTPPYVKSEREPSELGSAVDIPGTQSTHKSKGGGSEESFLKENGKKVNDSNDLS